MIPITGEAETLRPTWATVTKEPLLKTMFFIKVVSLPSKLQCLSCSYLAHLLMWQPCTFLLDIFCFILPLHFYFSLLPLVLYSYFIVSY